MENTSFKSSSEAFEYIQKVSDMPYAELTRVLQGIEPPYSRVLVDTLIIGYRSKQQIDFLHRVQVLSLNQYTKDVADKTIEHAQTLPTSYINLVVDVMGRNKNTVEDLAENLNTELSIIKGMLNSIEKEICQVKKAQNIFFTIVSLIALFSLIGMPLLERINHGRLPTINTTTIRK